MKIRYLSDIHLEFIQPQKLKRLVLDQILPAADGEICVTCDDAEFFPSDFLETYLKHYRRGCFMLGMHLVILQLLRIIEL